MSRKDSSRHARASLHPAAARKPNIFLLVVDSMRRDYLSTYNPAVTFTPEIGLLPAVTVSRSVPGLPAVWLFVATVTT